MPAWPQGLSRSAEPRISSAAEGMPVDRSPTSSQWLRRRAGRRLAFAALAVAVMAAATAAHAGCNGDVTDAQSVTGFSSLADGQPATPGQPNLVGYASYYGGETTVKSGVQYTPRGKSWCNTQFLVVLPNLFLTSRIDSTNTVGLGWQQRWLVDDGPRPTISTLVTTTFNWSTGLHAATTKAVLIVAKTVPGAVLYANAIVTHQFGASLVQDWAEAGIVGAKVPLHAKDALVGDIVVTRGAPAQLELTYQLRPRGSLNLAPGIAVILGAKPIATIGLAAQVGL